ncbi:MAG: Zn-ribbon domain-containing OB-fold protein [Acidimicrobiales bacterium]
MTASGPPIRLLPRLDADNTFFWTSGADGLLRFLRCRACRTYVHPPSPVCPSCLEGGLAPEPVSGRGVVESFTVNHQQWIPGSEPYVVAWVSIVEQPDVRLTTNLVGVEPGDLRVGMEVEVAFEEHEGVYLPLFRPAGSPA